MNIRYYNIDSLARLPFQDESVPYICTLEQIGTLTYDPLKFTLSIHDGVTPSGVRIKIEPTNIINLIPYLKDYFYDEPEIDQFFQSLEDFIEQTYEHKLGNPSQNGQILSSTTSGVRSWVTPYAHPSYTSRNITAATGQVINTFASNSLGHVTGITLRTLVEADIPTLSISKILNLQTALNEKVNINVIGQPNGIVPLDSNSKINTLYLPDSILGQVKYVSTWDASQNIPQLPDPTLVKGDYYVVSVAGVQFGINFSVGDWAISNGTSWEKVVNSDAVTTVFGRIGNVVAVGSDYSDFYVRYDSAQSLTSTQKNTARTNIGASSDTHTHAWTAITDKPTTFTPSLHNHYKADIVDFTHSHLWADISDKPAAFTPTSHTHTKSQITDFAHTHGKSDITDFTHTHAKADITDFAHTHLWADMTDKPSTFAPSVHTHPWTDITGKPTSFTPSAHTLDGHSNVTITSNTAGEILKWSGTAWVNNTLSEAGIAASVHSHTKSQITDFAHTHLWADITDKPSEFAPSPHTHLWADITDKPSTFEPSAHTHGTYNRASSVLVGGNVFSNIVVTNGIVTSISARTLDYSHVGAAAASHTHTKSHITDFAHTHPWSEITSTPTTIAGYGITDAAVSFGTRANTATTTANFIALLTSWGMFNYGHAFCKFSWSYAGNADLTDTGYGTIETAGAVCETWQNGDGTKMVRLICPNTGGGAYQELIYNDQGSTYSPGWRKVLNDKTFTAGTGAANYCAGNDDRLYNARPASDVYLWAKEVNKPTYTKGEVGLGNVPNIDATNPANITQSASYRFVSDTEKNTWNNKQNAITAGTALSFSSNTLNLDFTKLSDGTASLVTNHLIPWFNSANGLYYKASLDLLAGVAGWNAGKLQGKSVSTTAPSSGQILKFDGTSWTPSDLGSSFDIYSLTTVLVGELTPSADWMPLSVGYHSNAMRKYSVLDFSSQKIFNALYLAGKQISDTSPANGQALIWNSSTSRWTPTTIASSGVTSWNSRTGAVLPVSGDYSASMVTNAADLTASNLFLASQTINATGASLILKNSSSSSSAGIITQTSTGTNTLGVGFNPSISQAYFWVYGNYPIRFGINGVEIAKITTNPTLELKDISTSPSVQTGFGAFYSKSGLPYFKYGSTEYSLSSSSSGTVTSVGLSLPSIFSVTGSPVESSGTLTATLASQSRYTVLAAPNTGAGVPSFRELQASDITGGVFSTARLGTGTASSSTFLRGDGTWQSNPWVKNTGYVSPATISDEVRIGSTTDNGSYILQVTGDTWLNGMTNMRGKVYASGITSTAPEQHTLYYNPDTDEVTYGKSLNRTMSYSLTGYATSKYVLYGLDHLNGTMKKLAYSANLSFDKHTFIYNGDIYCIGANRKSIWKVNLSTYAITKVTASDYSGYITAMYQEGGYIYVTLNRDSTGIPTYTYTISTNTNTFYGYLTLGEKNPIVEIKAGLNCIVAVSISSEIFATPKWSSKTTKNTAWNRFLDLNDQANPPGLCVSYLNNVSGVDNFLIFRTNGYSRVASVSTASSACTATVTADASFIDGYVPQNGDDTFTKMSSMSNVRFPISSSVSWFNGTSVTEGGLYLSNITNTTGFLHARITDQSATAMNCKIVDQLNNQYVYIFAHGGGVISYSAVGYNDILTMKEIYLLDSDNIVVERVMDSLGFVHLN